MDGVAGCFHLAAIASVERGVREWRETHRVNLSAFVALLDAARARGGLPVVYASSAAVYGSHEELPLAETAPTRPLSAYGADKLGCELQARVAGAVHGIPTLGLRFFNVYGPRQDPASPYSGVISIFADRLLRGAPLTVFGDGQQSRDFVHVSAVVAALRAGMAAACAEAPVFNVCAGRSATVLELARALAEACGVTAEIRQCAGRAGEVRHSLGAPHAARAALDLGEPPAAVGRVARRRPLDAGRRPLLAAASGKRVTRCPRPCPRAAATGRGWRARRAARAKRRPAGPGILTCAGAPYRLR